MRSDALDDILGSVKTALANVWDGLPDKDKDDIKVAAIYAAEMLALEAAGGDVESDVRHLQAQLRNWQFVGSARAVAAFWVGVDKAAKVAGSLLGAAAKRALGL